MQSLKVKDLKPHPKNEYFFDDMTGQKYEEFRESIRTSGVIEPLIVTQDMVIVSGHQRRRGCIDEGIETVMCDVRYYADKDGRSKEDWILKDLIETNVRQRGEIGGSELKAIHRVDELRRIYGNQHGGDRKSANAKIKWDNVPLDPPGGKVAVGTLSQLANSPQTTEEVCAAAGIDYESYRKFKSLADLNPDWQELLEAGNVSASVASRIIAKLPSDKQTELLESLPADAKQRLTASEAKRYIDMLEQQQKEYDKQIAEMKQQNRKDIAELNDDNDAKAQRVIELENTVKELRTKRDPAMKKLYEQSERERQLSQSLQAEKCKLETQVQRLDTKLSEAASQVNDLLDDLDKAQADRDIEKEKYDRISAEKDREIAELRCQVKDLKAVAAEVEKSSASNATQFDTPYSMPTLLRYLSEVSEQIQHYALSEVLNVNSKDGDIDAVCSFVRGMEDNFNIIKTKLKGIA